MEKVGNSVVDRIGCLVGSVVVSRLIGRGVVVLLLAPNSGVSSSAIGSIINYKNVLINTCIFLTCWGVTSN